MDVGTWLRGLGLEQYEAVFRDNSVDADILPRLSGEDLKELGVASVGHRRKLLDAISELRAPTDSTGSAPPIAPSATRGQRANEVAAERRPITVMFCDLVDSTSLSAKLDAEDWRSLVNAYLDEASAAVTDLGGHVLKKLGDGLMALFGYPRAQENDAERAVRAALAIQRALADLNVRNARSGAPELSARIGIESGSVVVDAAGEVFGEAPNVAARVQAAAEPGSVLVTESVQRQVAGLFVVEDKGAHELKGVAQPLSLYRVVRASGAGRRGGGKALTQFVGREEELALLARRWERARAGDGQLVLVVGEPGLGKSRLIEEFHARLAEAPHTWVEWSASQLLQNTPLHPIAEWGRQRFGVDAPAEQRLADLEDTLRLIGLDPAEHAPLLAPLVDIPLPPDRAANLPPEELRRRQLAAMTAWVLAGARSQPLVLAFEDLHWADPTSLDLLRALAERGAQAPLLVLATTRPEFRSPWSLRSHHSVISLSPLDRAGVARMVSEISARHALSKEVIEGVSERTGGVPLFVEEVTRLLVERGEQGGVQAIPPTLQQSLAARLDRLGPAREVAQVGAVLGRDFVYPLLRDVAEADETVLRSSLDRLADADLLFVEGAPPQANYRFKHALIQDAAYDSLLKSRRQALHRRAADALLAADAEPEAIAHHFTEAGLDDPAIEWWGKAGDQALRRSAFQEAIAHLGKAIEMADKEAAPRRQEAVPARADIRANYARALQVARGYTAPATEAAYARMGEASTLSAADPAHWLALFGSWTRRFIGGELRAAREDAEFQLREAETANLPMRVAIAHRQIALTKYHLGSFAEARDHAERAIAGHDERWAESARAEMGVDHLCVAKAYLAVSLSALGEGEIAEDLMQRAERRAEDIGQPLSLAHVLTVKVIMFSFANRPKAVLRAAETLHDVIAAHGIGAWEQFARLFLAWARGLKSDARAHAREAQAAASALCEQGARLFGGDTRLLAELEAAAGSPDQALALIVQGLEFAERQERGLALPSLHRLRGDILFTRDPAGAEDAYYESIRIAREQGARTFVLLAALPLAKLLQTNDRPVDAHDALAAALEGFTPTPEMPEIAEAQALLAALLQTDEVKAEAVQQQRLTQLHVAHGNALIAARGYGAPETTEAFAKARVAGSTDKNVPARLAAHYGLWVGSYARGELSSMRAHAAAFLNDLDASHDSPEAGVAHRAAGLTCWFAGEYREALEHLERALALFQSGRDDDLAFRFGPDAGAAVLICSAIALWPLGEVERAISLAESARTRLAAVTHAGTLAFGRQHSALFELMRRDRSRATQDAFELARLADEHDLNLWRAFAVFLQGWAATQSGATPSGIQGMRRGVEQLREQNVAVFDGLLKTALAEAEAQVGDSNRAVAILDEALATADRLGHRAFEAELHRVRGEILIKRDPANPAHAEDALLTAIAVAAQQGTRSFGLRAAVSLAKLYQSTDRPDDAHAVLAPALEGFAPTDEMPEIAAAQALLVAIEAGARVRHD
jgi:class 3 adenylate cyclase/predicted ATPase